MADKKMYGSEIPKNFKNHKSLFLVLKSK